MNFKAENKPKRGQVLARGVTRHLNSLGFVSLEEFMPTSGLRTDLFALGPKGEMWIIECKSSKLDFKSDNKWYKYLAWGDKFFWAVDQEFPVDILPEKTGIIIADGYDASVVRVSSSKPLSPARRKVLTLKFAMKAAQRLQKLRDPNFTYL